LWAQVQAVVLADAERLALIALVAVVDVLAAHQSLRCRLGYCHPRH
jgi:hypothetical protein